MKLIKKLPPKYINGRCVSFGLFWCDSCKSEVERPLGNGLKCESCGCLKIKHKEIHNRLYKIWWGMKQRVLNPNHTFYKNYGGRGIMICPEWTDKLNGFINFRDWALSNGYAENLQINRIENDGNYESNNCNWVVRTENQRNRRKNVIKSLQIANEIRELDKIGKYTRKELSEKYAASQSIISYIINNKIWKNK